MNKFSILLSPFPSIPWALFQFFALLACCGTVRASYTSHFDLPRVRMSYQMSFWLTLSGGCFPVQSLTEAMLLADIDQDTVSTFQHFY